MKKIIIALTLFFINASVFAAPGDPPAGAGIGPMNYQGRLLDNAGVPVTGTYTFTVRIYDALTGGNIDFEEQHSGVNVDDGVYSFLIGQGEVLSGNWDIGLWNNNELYLEIEVNNEILTPRHRLAAAPFAFQANLALTTNDALALGGKSAAEYDSTLEAICVSSKGKWLELVEKCLGIGALFPQGVQPAPTFVNWSDLTASNDFSNLDLSRADISGITFGDANFSGTVFRGTTYYVGSFSDANLTDTIWDGAVAVAGMYPEYVGPNTIFNEAVFKNMDMSQWKLSLVNQSGMVGLSAANLSNCPSDLPAEWECRNDQVTMYGNFLLGPGVNLSASSAAAVSKFGSSYLNLGSDVLNNINLTGASFEGNVLTQDFSEVNFMNANFNSTVMRSNIFASTDLNGATFVGSRLDKPVFLDSVGFNNGDFTNAELSYVRFEKSMEGANFTKATLKTVDFIQNVVQSNFTGAVLDEVAILGNTGDNIFDGTRFYHGFQHGGVGTASNTYIGGSTFNNLTFIGGNLIGDFTGATFTGAFKVSGVSAGPKLDLCGATFPLVNGVIPGWNIAMGGECPDGEDYTPCNISPHMNPIPVAQCTVGVP